MVLAHLAAAGALLLIADVLAVNLAAHDPGPQAADHSIIVQMVQETQQVNAQTVSVQRVQVVDQNNNAVLAFGDINEISAISITGNAGNDNLTIDASSFAGHTAPAISFVGGSGQNNIIFDNSGATNWSLTGPDAGTVSGNGVNASFQNVGNLTGAANNNDTLTVEKGGTLSGTYDGGVGGFDSLVFDNGPHASVAYSPTGPNSGAIVEDGQTFNFKGLEPVSLGAVSHVIVDTSAKTGGSTSPDPLTTTLQTLGGSFSSSDSNDNLVVSGTDHNGASFEYITFHADSAASGLELTLGAGDTMQVDSLPDIGKNLTIDGASSVTFANSITETDALSVTASATGGQSISGSSASAQSISALGVDASITVNSGVTLTASSISLSAQSTTTASIAAPVHSHGVLNTSDLTSATITTENTATVTLDGTLSSSGAVSVTTSVNLIDTVNAAGTDGENLTAVTVTPTDTSEVLLGSAAAISGRSVDL